MPKAEPPLTLAHCLIHQSRCTVCLQKSNPTRFSAALSPLVRRCLNSSSRVPRVGSDLFTFLYDNFIYLNLMYGLTKLSLVKHNSDLYERLQDDKSLSQPYLPICFAARSKFVGTCLLQPTPLERWALMSVGLDPNLLIL